MTTPSALIIEDDPHISEIFSRTLAPNFEVEVCLDGPAALRQLDQAVPNLVLLDLHLPRLSGETILQHIHANQRFAKTMVVIISADLFLAEKLEDQADLTLYKPISINQLREVITLMQLQGRI